jgi:hypothetical protein
VAGQAQTRFTYTAYTHSDGYTVKVPQGWEARNRPVRITDPTGSVWVQLYTQRVAGNDLRALWNAADQSNKRDSSRNPDYQLVGITDARAGDRPAADWEFTYQRSGESERRRVLDRVVVVDGVSYQFGLSAPESQFAKYRSVLDELAASLRVTG